MDDALHILIVDDTASNAVFLSAALRKAGYKTTVAHEGLAAIKLAQELHPDLILLDWMMPGLDGLETCRRLKQSPDTASIPIVFVTALDDVDRVVQALKVGGADYVVKPVRVAELVARVSVHLRLRQAEVRLKERNAELEKIGEQLREANELLTHQSRIDGLTGLLNRGAWDQCAAMEHDRAVRFNRPYGILMIDVDLFKAFNDSLGHQAGDDCLRRVAACLTQVCRSYDIVGRYGGEEFCILLPETSEDAAAALAERIRAAVWSESIAHPQSAARRVTVSIGVSQHGGNSLAEVIRGADAALYRAKCGGRNLVFGAAGLPANLAVDDPHEMSASSAAASMKSPIRTSKVLIVDDNRTNRLVCRGSLEKDGYEIHEAQDGVEAIEAVDADRPDVIIMDVMMPRMDGLECTRCLKSNAVTKDIPIIIVSARTEPSDIVEGLKAGAEEYLTKPVRTIELATRVRSMLRLARERADLLHSYQLRAEQIRVLVMLVEFARKLGTAVSVDEVLEATLRAAAELCASRRISIMLADPAQKQLTIARAIGIDDELAKGIRVPIHKGVAGQVFASNRSIIVNEPGESQNAISRYESPFFVSAPLLSAPLSSSGEAVGVLNLTDRVGGRPFEDSELGYIELLAGIAGACLHSAINRSARDESRDLIVLALARLAEHRDNDTARHVERVTEYSLLIAEELGSRVEYCDIINPQFLHDLRRAAALHDIGKVAIPDNILLKPGKLTLQEMAIIRSHTDIGAATLRPIIERIPNVSFLQMAEQIVRSHHERFDGAGYPDGLQGERIPLSARIVGLADVYDALTTKRVYKEAMSHADAVQLIKSESGKHFDPAVVEAMLSCESKFLELSQRLADTISHNTGGIPSRRIQSIQTNADPCATATVE